MDLFHPTVFPIFFQPKKPLLILRVKPLFFSLLHLSLLSFSSLFLFLLSFSFPASRTPFHSNDWKFDRLVFKKSARSFQRILPIFQSGKWRFRPFGINAAHFAESYSRIFENFTAKWTFCVQQFFFGRKQSLM